MDVVVNSAQVVFSLLAIALSSLLLYLLNVYYLRPYALRRVLLRQGFTVLPYRPVIGDLLEIAVLQSEAQLCDIPSPSNHHLVYSHVQPFFHNLLTQYPAGSKVFYWVGNTPTLLLNNVKDVGSLLSTDGKKLYKPNSSRRVFQKIVGNGLLTSNGNDWHQHRSIVCPAFLPEKLKEIVVDMVTSSVEMIETWDLQSVKHGGMLELEVAQDIKNMTADILARSSFGSSYVKGKAIFERQEILLGMLSEGIVKTDVIPFYEYLHTSTNRKVEEMDRRNNKELSEIIKSRRKAMEMGNFDTQHKTDLLSLMLATAKGEAKNDKKLHLSTQQVVDECKTFFFAGHETTTNLVAWTLVLLSLHQELQDKAREEVLQVCGVRAQPHFDHLNHLKIVGMIINETLRLYPPVPHFGGRTLLSELKLSDGRTLPKGSALSIPTRWFHTDKELWGDDAFDFKPDRFEHGLAKACKDPQAFMPFGMGPRICIGQNFALMVVKVIISLILQHFQFQLSPTYRHAPLQCITMRPNYGVHLIMKSLSHQ